MDISFYGTLNTGVERAVAKLLEKTYKIEKKALLLVENKQQEQEFDSVLWKISSWLPHSTIDEKQAKEAPIIISAFDNEKWKELNNYDYAFLVNNTVLAEELLKNYEKLFIVFDLKNDNILNYNRNRWKDLKTSNHTIIFYKQDKDGVFIKNQNE